MRAYQFLCFKILILGMILIQAGCSLLSLTPAQERDFATQDLLINGKDMPSGWNVLYGPQKDEDTSISSDSAMIVFAPPSNPDIGSVMQYVYRFNSIQAAKYSYKDEIQFPGITAIKGWSFISSVTDESKVSCYTYSNRDIPVCTWYARYDEFVVEFIAWIEPGGLSIHEMENVVKIIDQKAAKLVGKDTQP